VLAKSVEPFELMRYVLTLFDTEQET